MKPMHRGASPRARARVGAVAPALFVALSATAATAAGQCEMLKQQYAACAERGLATQAPQGDFSYIAVCHDRFPYMHACPEPADASFRGVTADQFRGQAALGHNDPEGNVWKPEPPAAGARTQTPDTSLRDRLRARLDDWRTTRGGAGATGGWQSCAVIGGEFICQTTDQAGDCRTTIMLPGEGGRSWTEEGCDPGLFAGAADVAPDPRPAAPRTDPDVVTQEACEASGNTWAQRDPGPGWEAPGAALARRDVWQCYVSVSLDDDPHGQMLRNEIKFLWEDGAYR